MPLMRCLLLLALCVCTVAIGADKSARSAARRSAPRASTPSAAPRGSDLIESGGTTSGGGRSPTRIDFDDRLIQGQTNKSGAVYLYDRKELQVSSMVKLRNDFRGEWVNNFHGR